MRILTMDLAQEESIKRLMALLATENPRIRILVNSAGCGRIGNFFGSSYEGVLSMINVNCKALTAVTYACLLTCHGQSDPYAGFLCSFCAPAGIRGVCSQQGVCAQLFSGTSGGMSGAGAHGDGGFVPGQWIRNSLTMPGTMPRCLL